VLVLSARLSAMRMLLISKTGEMVNAVAQTGAPATNGDYNKDGVQKAIDNYSKAVKLLSKISTFADDQINAGYLLQKCNMGLDASNELMKTLK
jgi:hypothetical protein